MPKYAINTAAIDTGRAYIIRYVFHSPAKKRYRIKTDPINEAIEALATIKPIDFALFVRGISSPAIATDKEPTIIVPIPSNGKNMAMVKKSGAKMHPITPIGMHNEPISRMDFLRYFMVKKAEAIPTRTVHIAEIVASWLVTATYTASLDPKKLKVTSSRNRLTRKSMMFVAK